MCTEIQMVFISALAGNVIQWLCIFFHSCLKVNIVHHYSQVPYLHVHPLSKMYFNPQVALHCIFKSFPEVCKAARKLSCPTLLLPVEVEQGGCLFVSAACFSFGDRQRMETGGGNSKKLLSWGQLEEFESQLGLLLIGQPQVSNLTLVNMLFSFVKERK